jgi:glycosyltransferase involved in cell wall biosynthesis
MDLEPFTSRPPARLPESPEALFVGVLERYKAVDVVATAWPQVSASLPEARLHLVGKGTLEPLVSALVAAGGGRVRWTPELPAVEIARALDAASILVLPSRREGMGRIIVESFCRGRAVVGTVSGGITDLVEDGVSGLLVPVDDADALADALMAVLGDRELATRLGAGAHAASSDWAASPGEFARRTRELVDRVLAGRA